MNRSVERPVCHGRCTVSGTVSMMARETVSETVCQTVDGTISETVNENIGEVSLTANRQRLRVSPAVS